MPSRKQKLEIIDTNSTAQTSNQQAVEMGYVGRDSRTGLSFLRTANGSIVPAVIEGNATPFTGESIFAVETDSVAYALGRSVITEEQIIPFVTPLSKIFAAVLFTKTDFAPFVSNFFNGEIITAGSPVNFIVSGPFLVDETLFERWSIDGGKLLSSLSFTYTGSVFQDASEGPTISFFDGEMFFGGPTSGTVTCSGSVSTTHSAYLTDGPATNRISVGVNTDSELLPWSSLADPLPPGTENLTYSVSDTVNVIAGQNRFSFIIQGLTVDMFGGSGGLVDSDESFSVSCSISFSEPYSPVQEEDTVELWIGGDRVAVKLAEYDTDEFENITGGSYTSSGEVNRNAATDSYSISDTVPEIVNESLSLLESGDTGELTIASTGTEQFFGVDADFTITGGTGWGHKFDVEYDIADLAEGTYSLKLDASFSYADEGTNVLAVGEGFRLKLKTAGTVLASWERTALLDFDGPSGESSIDVDIPAIGDTVILEGGWDRTSVSANERIIVNITFDLFKETAITSYVSANSQNRIVYFEQDNLTASYFTITETAVIQVDYTKPDVIITDPNDWRSSLATFVDPPPTDPNNCFQADRSNPFVNLQSGSRFTVDIDQIVDGGNTFNNTLLLGNEVTGAETSVSSYSDNGLTCDLGVPQNEELETVQQIITPSEPLSVEIVSVTAYRS